MIVLNDITSAQAHVHTTPTTPVVTADDEEEESSDEEEDYSLLTLLPNYDKLKAKTDAWLPVSFSYVGLSKCT